MHPKLFVGRALSGPTGGAYSAPPDPQLDLRGLLLRKGRGGVGRGGEGKEGEGREEEGRSGLPLYT